MKKTYTPPALEEVGTVAALTAALGTAPRPDFNESSLALGDGAGSIDICRPDVPSDPNSSCSETD